MRVAGQWYTMRCVMAEYVKSPTKGTPGFQMKLQDDHGDETGYWWMSQTVNSKGRTQVEEVFERLKQLGGDEEKMRSAEWSEYCCGLIAGKEFAVLIEEDDRGALVVGAVIIPRVGFTTGDRSDPSPFAKKGGAW